MKRIYLLVALLFAAFAFLPAVGFAQPKDDLIRLYEEAYKLGNNPQSNEDLVRAVQKYEQAMTISQRLGEKRFVGICANQAGLIYQHWGQYDKAVEYYEKSLAIAREFKDRKPEANALLNLGNVYRDWGQYDKAVKYYEKSLAIAREFKDRKPEANALLNLGNVYRDWGQYEKAVKCYEKSLAIARELKDRRGERFTLNNLGIVYKNWGQYEKAVGYYEKSLTIAREFKDRKSEADALNNLGNVFSDWGQHDKAVSYYEKSLAIARELKNRPGEVNPLNNLGIVYKNWGQYEKAVGYYEKSLAISLELKDRKGEGRALNNLGLVFSDWGQYEKAVEFYEKSLAIELELKNRLGEGKALNNLGSVFYHWGQYEKAVEFYGKDLAISLELKDRKGEGRALHNLGNVFSDWGQYDKAKEYYEKSLAIERELKDPGGEGGSLNNLGIVYKNWGQYEKAVGYYEKSLAIDLELKDREREGKALNNLGIVYKNWGQYAKAVEFYEKSLAIDLELKDRKGEGRALNNLGNVYMDWGQYDKAVEFYEKSLAIKRELKDPAGEASSLSALGGVYSTWGQYDKATQSYERALAIRKELRDPRGEASALSGMGTIHWRRGEYQEALAKFQRELEIYQQLKLPTRWTRGQLVGLYIDMERVDFAESIIKELTSEYEDQRNKTGLWSVQGRFFLAKGDYQRAGERYSQLLKSAEGSRSANDLFTAYTGLGTSYEAAGDNRRAESHFRKGVELVEELRSSLSGEQRETFFDVKINGFYRTTPYEGLARVLMKLERRDEAWNSSEYTRARMFAEAMSRQAGRQEFDLPKDILRIDEELNGKLAALRQSIQTAYEKANKLLIESLQPQIKKLESRLQAHIQMLREKYPLFAATKYPQPMDLSQTALKDNEWVLSYDVTDPGILIYLTKGKTLTKALFKPIPKKEVDELVRKFREPLEIKEGTPIRDQLKKFDFASGKKLADLLLSDVLPVLPKDAPVTVIPGGSLGIVPFEMLVLNEGGKIASEKERPQVTGAEFFGDRNPISYYQSVTALTLARTLGKQKASGQKILVMDDPVFGPDDPRIRKAAESKKRATMAALPDKLMSIKKEIGLTFPRLPLTGELGQTLKKLEPSKTDEFSGIRATKSVLFDKPLNQYSSMVFATHGYFGKDLPGIMEPVLVLTLPGQPEGKDGFLRLSEVMGLNINADTVALTACQTGLGRQISGEGTMGMGRAFQYAGAKSVLMSLWSVHEQASVKLVESFFRNLKVGRSKLESLKLARDEIRKSGYDHPFYWAPFILVGEVN